MADDVKERLEKRQEARLSELDRRKQERAARNQPEEDPKTLLSIFNKEKQLVEEMLEDVVNLEKNVLVEHFDEMSRKTQLLQKFLSDSLAFLPSYDVKRLQQEIDKLEQDITQKRNHYLPKKKFAFSKKKQPRIEQPAVQSDKIVMAGVTNAESQGLSTDTAANSELLVSGQQITKEQTELQDKDITFSKLQESTITLHGSPSALRLQKLEHCKVFCGPVSGSVFIDDCTDCTFIFPCQQLRVHTTFDCHFYLLVTSRAIIEDCQHLGFAEFNWNYKGIDEHFEMSRLDRTKNNWNLVNDFNWLRTNKQSPNWYLLQEKERVKLWN